MHTSFVTFQKFQLWSYVSNLQKLVTSLEVFFLFSTVQYPPPPLNPPSCPKFLIGRSFSIVCPRSSDPFHIVIYYIEWVTTVFPRSSDPSYEVTYYIKWVTTSWTCTNVCRIRFYSVGSACWTFSNLVFFHLKKNLYSIHVFQTFPS